ncbi:MAG TPA: hypothetical protein VMC09_01970 [Anaerolineales bacterium]|nr:hypothetical protein [Anaerolineales bacterium]
MKKLRLLVSFALVFLMFTQIPGAAAQSSYYFSLDREVVNVFWNSDGTEAVDYVFTFTNDPSGHIIDFVDVGMPNSNFDTGSISADVGGTPVNISSDYQGQGGSGFSVDMGASAIPAGQQGSVHVYVGRITGVLYKDTDNPDTYASADFSPTWFGSQYVNGSTDLTVAFHLPPGVQPQEPKYHSVQGGWPCADQPASAYDDQNRITYTWQCSNASGSTQYTFGASFPKSYVPADAIVVPPAFDIGGFLSGMGSTFQTFCCFGFFILMFVGAPILGAINNRKRKLQYLPPKIQIEGHGIKRGLTAVESAILMEQPLDKVMTMILFGVVKKNAATVVTRDPLKLQVASPLPADLHEYETDFLAAFADDNLATRRKGLQDMTVKLVNSVSDKMKGFSRKETVAYYQSIMEQAWKQIEAAGTPEVKSQMYDQALEWTMLDKNYDERTRRVFTGPIFMPMWWGNYDPGYRAAPIHTGTPSVSTPGSGSSGGRISLPGSAMAASMVTGVQGFSSKVLGDLGAFTSNVTNKTNPIPVSTSSGHYSGGGGHSCACACACAGCACACAGGGR